MQGYASVSELTRGLTSYFRFYNKERPHQSLGYKTPEAVYQAAAGGGAQIVDKFAKLVEVSPVEGSETALTSTRKTLEDANTKVRSGQRRPAVSKMECIT